jgi:glycosyltransferase involved in cell wall biosynthesis
VNPLKAVGLIFRLAKIYRQEKPDIVHHVAIKPILYGSIAARLAGVPHVVNALTGMGYIFTSKHIKARLLRPFINLSFKTLLNSKHAKLIMQNDEDRRALINSGIVNEERTVLIRGAGVNTTEYAYIPEPLESPPLIALPARMLKDKGVAEFVAAAEILKKRGVNARFVLVGDADYQNHAAVSEVELKGWVDSGVVEWWGRKENMPEVLASANVICLPSYREGLPKALLEAASCGRAIVTTDTVGCREVVNEGENGFVVPVHSTVELADALLKLIESPPLRQQMGLKGRKMVMREFAVEKVIAETLYVYATLLSARL